MNDRTYAEGIYAESNKIKGGSNQEISNYLGGCYSMGCGKAQARFCWGFTDFIGKGRSPFSSAISPCDRPFDLFFRFSHAPSDAGCEKGDRATQQKRE